MRTATQQIIDGLVELRDNTDQLDQSQGLQQIKELLDRAENETLVEPSTVCKVIDDRVCRLHNQANAEEAKNHVEVAKRLDANIRELTDLKQHRILSQ